MLRLWLSWKKKHVVKINLYNFCIQQRNKIYIQKCVVRVSQKAQNWISLVYFWDGIYNVDPSHLLYAQPLSEFFSFKLVLYIPKNIRDNLRIFFFFLILQKNVYYLIGEKFSCVNSITNRFFFSFVLVYPSVSRDKIMHCCGNKLYTYWLDDSTLFSSLSWYLFRSFIYIFWNCRVEFF